MVWPGRRRNPPAGSWRRGALLWREDPPDAARAEVPIDQNPPARRGGIFGTLLGGRIGDRFGSIRAVQIGNCLLIPAFAALLLCDNKYAALPLITAVGLITNIPFAVLIKLGQDYLPSRPGTAAGVTLGLAVSAGGLFQPALGVIADHHGPQGAFVVIALIPLLAIALAINLKGAGTTAARHRW